jgi:hypothetical protein
MMNNQETAKMLAVIKSVYPNFIISEESTKLWAQFMKPVRWEKGQAHLNEHIASSRFPPVIADIVRYNPKQTSAELRDLRWERDEAFREYINAGGDGELFDHAAWDKKEEALKSPWTINSAPEVSFLDQLLLDEFKK